MRGLTPEERSALLGEVTTTEAIYRSLIARGLGVPLPPEDAEYEGQPATLHQADITPLGELALRLDAAARGVVGA